MRGAGRGKGIQYFPRGTIRDTVFPKNILHGGAKYPRISCIGVPKRGDVIITVTPVWLRDRECMENVTPSCRLHV